MYIQRVSTLAGAEILGGQGVLKPPHVLRWGGRAPPLFIFGLPEEVFALLAHPLLACANVITRLAEIIPGITWEWGIWEWRIISE